MSRTRRISLFCLAAALSLTMSTGCSNEDDTDAPVGLAFADLEPVLLQGIAISVSPSYTGDSATSFTVTPALPAGLTLDSVTGVISGTPLAVTPPGTYTVTASNSGGSSEVVLTLTVHPQAPCGLTYQQEDIKYVGLVTVVSNAPIYGCGPADTWTITPALPAGLTLDPATGVIAGTATDLISRTEFVITASNITGSAARSIFIEVETPAPCGLSYSGADVVYPPTVAIPANQPSSACGRVDSYAIAPSLPAGLSFDTATGEITGTPTVETGEITYTITASNSFGSDSAEVKIRISPVFVYTAENVAAEYDPNDGSGSFSVRLLLEEGSNNATFPTPILGLSLALGNTDNHLSPATAAAGADLQAMNGGAGPSFFQPTLQPNAVTIGIIFDFALVEVLVADSEKEIALLTYSTEPSWLAGDTDGAETTLTWGNPNPSPPISNEVGLSGIYSVTPIRNDSTVSLSPAAP